MHRINRLLAVAAIGLILAGPGISRSERYGAPIESKVDLSYLIGTRRPIWMGPVIRYTVYEKTRVEARFTALSGEIVHVMRLGEQEPGQYTLPWDGTTADGMVTFEGKYHFELFFGDEYAADFWIMSRSLQSFDET